MNAYQPNYLNDSKYYIPNNSTIVLIDNKDFHYFYNKETKWSCDICLGKCIKSKSLKQILTECSFNQPTATQKEIVYPTISTLPLPLFLDEKMAIVYENQQQCDRMNLPIELYPEREFCEYGYEFNLSENVNLVREGIIIYTAKAIIELAEHRGRIRL